MKAHLMIFGLLLICSGAALAQGTPDFMTPSQETICDGESGAAYGLCNAYCEAMDCDSPNAQASATACSKVKDKFTNITGRSLPCDTCPPPPPGTPCPCVGASIDFDNVLSSPGVCLEQGTFALKDGEGLGEIAASCSSTPPFGAFCGSVGPNNGLFILPVTPEEGSACVQLILDSCTPE